MNSFTIQIRDEEVGVIAGPDSECAYPWRMSWFGPGPPRDLLVWAAEGSDPTLISLLTCADLARKGQGHN